MVCVWGKGLWEFGRLIGFVSRPKWGLMFFSPTETFQLEPYESQPRSQHGRSSSAHYNESLMPTVISLNALLGLLWITASTGWGGRVWGIYCMLVFIIPDRDVLERFKANSILIISFLCKKSMLCELHKAVWLVE